MNIKNRETILQELRRLKPELEQWYGVTKIGILGSFARNEIHRDRYDKTLLRERLEQLSEKWSGLGKTHKKTSVCSR